MACVTSLCMGIQFSNASVVYYHKAVFMHTAYMVDNDEYFMWDKVYTLKLPIEANPLACSVMSC